MLAGLDSAGGKTAFLTGPFYYYSLALLAILAFLAWRLVHSPLGLHMRAVRDNPQKAAYLGVKVQRTRLWAFVISAVYCSHCWRADRHGFGPQPPGTRLLDAISAPSSS